MSPNGCFMRIGSSTEPMLQNLIEDLFACRTRHSIGKITEYVSNHVSTAFQDLHGKYGIEVNMHGIL